MVVRFWQHNDEINWIWEYQKGNNTGVEKRHIPNHIAAIDYLRSKGYATKFRGIDLIESGIAEYVK